MTDQASGRIDLSGRLEEWRRLLLDTSKRSRLVNSKFGRGGVLGIEHPDFYPLWEHLAVKNQPAEFPWPSQWIDADSIDAKKAEPDAEEHKSPGLLSAAQLQAIKNSPELAADALLTNLPDRPLDGRLKRLAIAASTSLSEQGVNSLFLAFGFLRWFESADSELPILSPLVLMPVSLRKQSADSTWTLAPVDDDLMPNHPLAELLRSEFRLSLPPLPEEVLGESSEAIKSYFAEIERAIAGHDRWNIQLTAGLGTFAFQKISMWQDLGKNGEQIASHPLCRGIAGDPSLMPTSDASDILGCDLDSAVCPEASYLVRDCDSSQLAAIEVVQQGHHLILDGPPGTGKSQTITNIISQCLANHKTVLFVSEKAAALDVVKRRLDEASLGDFCLECHSHKANKRAVVEELGRCLNRPTETYPSQEDKFSELRRTRRQLNEYVRALHAKRSALEWTVYGVHGRLARIRTTSATRVVIPGTHAIGRAGFQEMEEAVARLASSSAVIAGKANHPWRNCRTERYTLTLPDDIRFHFARAETGLRERLEAARPLEKHGFLPASPTRQDLALSIEAATAALTYPKLPPRWVEAGLAQTAERYLALHALSQDYRILCSSVSAYAGDAPVKADPAIAVQVSAGSAALRAMLPQLPATARKRADYLEDVVSRFESIADLAGKLQDATRALSESLGLPPTSASTANAAAGLAANAIALAGMEQAKAQWFDAAERRRLRQIAGDAKQIASMATATRLPLEPKFLPLAFTAIASQQIDDVLRHQAWFRRFGGSWRRARQSFLPLYRAQAPASARELLDDAYQLQRFHHYVAQLKAAAGPDREALLWDESVDFDWEPIIGRLETIELFPAELQNSETARSIATSRDAAARQAIVSAAHRVQELFGQLSSAISAAAEIVANREMLDASTFGELPVAALKAKTGEAGQACRAQISALKAVFPLLEDQHDVAIDALANDFQVLVELRNLHENAGEIASALGEALPEIGSRSLGDWKDRADLAEWVSAFVKQHGGAPPGYMIRSISDDAVRAELSSAVQGLKSADTPELRDSARFVESLFSPTEAVSTGIVLASAPIAELAEWLSLRVRDADRIGEWVSYTSACDVLHRLGLDALREEIVDGRVPTAEAVDVLRQRFYRLWLDEAYRSEAALGEFDLAQHDYTVGRFREVDRFSVKNGFAQVRSKVLLNNARGGAAEGEAPDHSELGILLREVNKRRRHLPLRKLFASIPSLLLKLKPCVMMSPLAVSTYFDNGGIRFDVVIFDEASQVRPHDAICAIYRGSQLIVAGDQKQLPPTNFFERLGNEDDDDENEELEYSSDDFESILDMCATLGLPRQRLKWHYRSRRESLIAFSNLHFYNGELVTFPSARDVDGSSGVAFCFVENGRWAGKGAGGVNEAEAERIAEMVLRHAAEQPDKSLGVITMNQSQQMRILELIETRRRASLHLEEFFSHEKPDPFFVKNLENVQGDERDVIFVGVGYARNDAGTLSHNFGPLNRQGGERRLNVAITRAREALTIFASIHSDDIDLSRTQARGAKLLRAYLDFAERGIVALIQAQTEDSERDFDSDFEVEVSRALVERGLDVHRQIGCSGFRIDLAIVDPAQPGRYVLGVECDGATYHSSATARDRDRLRQDVLESLGWKLCRIWSTDWIRDPRRQIQKVIDAYQCALADIGPAAAKPAAEEVLKPVENAQHSPPSNGDSPMQFASIDEVPAELLRTILTGAVESFGAMPIKDLLQAASRKLGFARTGARIRDRVTEEVERLKGAGKLVEDDDGRLRLPKPAFGA